MLCSSGNFFKDTSSVLLLDMLLVILHIFQLFVRIK